METNARSMTRTRQMFWVYSNGVIPSPFGLVFQLTGLGVQVAMVSEFRQTLISNDGIKGGLE